MPSAASASGNIVVMGRVLAPFGVRGSIKVRPLSEAPDALLAHESCWLRGAGGSAWREARRTGGRMHGGTLIVELAGIETREAALALKGADVGVPRSALPPAAEGEIYQADLVGMTVVNREGKTLGVVVGIAEHGGHPLLRVARADGTKGAERLIPYVPPIVDRVDRDGRRIDVDWGEDF